MKTHKIRAIFDTKHGQVAKTMCGRYVLRSQNPERLNSRKPTCLSCRCAR